MEDTPRKGTSTGRWLKWLLKIAVTVICLWYVSGKIDFEKTGIALRKADWFFLFVALLLFILSKLISAIRLNIYFRNIGIHLGNWQNTRLYWLGMFYNLFLPGSISGDAYKVILLSKRYTKPYKKTTAAVLLDRVSGLAGLGLILAVYGLVVLDKTGWALGLLAGALLAVAALYLIIRKIFRDFITSFAPTLFLGIAVQALQVIAVYFIMMALHIPVSNAAYIFLFLVSSVVSVLPLTIGPLGIREVVFLQGAAYLGLEKESAVLVSILFFLITLFVSAWGLVYVFRNPLAEAPGSHPAKKTPAL